MTVTGLHPGSTYYFAVRAQDDVPNLGDLSNSPSGTTKGLCGSISTDMTWSPANNPYIVTCDITVATGVTLTIQLGTEVRFNQNYGITINGTLSAVGTDGQPILFTANTDTPTKGYWKGLNFSNTSLNSQLDYVTVEYGGYGNNGNVRITTSVIWISNATLRESSNYGIYATSLVDITLSESTLINNTNYAAYLSFVSGTFTSLSGNTGTGNGKNGIVLAGSMGLDTTLPVNAGLPYIITSSDFTVATGITLTVPAGNVFKFDTSSNLVVNGILNVNGTAQDQVVFTSLKDDSVGGDTNNDGSLTAPAKGDWGRIIINANGAANFDYVTVSFGGRDGSTYTGEIQAYGNSNVLLNQSTISGSYRYGIETNIVTGTATTILATNSTIEGNGNTGIYCPSSGTLNLTLADSTVRNNLGPGVSGNTGTFILTGNHIYSNSTYGVQLTSIQGISFDDNLIENNGNYAAFLSFNGGGITSLTGNTGTGNGKNGIALAGSMGQDTTLPVNTGLPYIIMSSDFTVATGTTLTIPAGNVFKFDTSSNLVVNGILNVNGTAQDQVVFTSLKDDSIGGDTNNDGTTTTPAKGDWESITIGEGGNVSLDYTTIRYGGHGIVSCSLGSCNENGVKGTVYSVNNNITFSMQHSTIDLSENAGIYFKGSNISLTITDSSLSNNGSTSTTGTYAQVHEDQGIYYNNSAGGNPSLNNISVINNIGNGVEILGPANVSISDCSMENNGENGLSLSGVANLQLTNSYLSANIRKGLNGSVSLITLSSNVLENNGEAAVDLNLSNATGMFFSENIVDFNGMNAFVFTGTISGNINLPQIYPIPYVLRDTLTINPGASITFPPGTQIKAKDINSSILVQGNFASNGTLSNPIYITSLKDDSVGGDTNADGSTTTPAKGDWESITIGEGGSVNLDYTTIRYGGYEIIACSLGSCNEVGVKGTIYSIDNNISLLMQHSTIDLSENAGIYLKGSNIFLTVTNSTLSNNGSTSTTGTYARVHQDQGIYYNNSADGGFTINDSKVFGNIRYGIYNGNITSVITAKNVWWGSSSGPAPYGSGNGINYQKIYDSTCKCYTITKYYVDVSPWQGQSYSYGQSVNWNAYVAEPVNTATGNYTYQRTDLSIPTRSLPLSFSRSYNSAAPANGPLGYGWTFSYNVYITESNLDNSATATYGDGRTVRFTWDGAEYVPPAGTFSTLVKSGGLFTLTEKDQTVYTFNASNKLATITDKNGNITSLNYTGINLTSVTAPDGRSLTFSYDGSNRITQMADPLTRTLGFTYDVSGDLVTFTDLRDKNTTYTYDTDHRLLTITDANNHTFVTNTYNDNGRVGEQLDAEGNPTIFVYDIEAHKTFVTDARLNTTTYEYDADLRLVKVTDPLGHFESYTWDGDNNRTSVTDKRNNTTAYTYDERGNLLTVTDPLSGATTYTYDSFNNLLTQTDALTHVTAYTYDGNDNLVTKTDAKHRPYNLYVLHGRQSKRTTGYNHRSASAHDRL